MKKRVLFVCTANSARSIMAEALLRQLAGDRFDVSSAGTEPTAVDPRTLAAIHAYGLPTGGLQSKSLAEFSGRPFDFVITLCARASRECRHWRGGGVTLHWDFPDPAVSGDALAFRRALNEISERIKLFVLVNDRDTARSSEPLGAVGFFKCLADETRLSCLLLIDREGELCVCELMAALELAQPTISRHLALMRKAGLLLDRRQGQWVYYRLHPLLPRWMAAVLRQTGEHSASLMAAPRQRLAAMARRPASCQPVPAAAADKPGAS